MASGGRQIFQHRAVSVGIACTVLYTAACGRFLRIFNLRRSYFLSASGSTLCPDNRLEIASIFVVVLSTPSNSDALQHQRAVHVFSKTGLMEKV